MDKIAETLQGDYEAFINQPQPLGFFSSLADYVGFVLQTPSLKAIVDDVMKGKQDMFDELEKLANQSLQEMESAREKLLKIIEDNKIDPASLTIRYASAPGVSSEYNLLEQLEMFEKNEVGKSGFRSHRVGEYLFDIAVNLAKMGHGASLKEFIVTGDEYARHYENPDDDPMLRITGNIHGNFVFSKTEVLVLKQDARIDRAHEFDLWGALDPLLKLHEAFVARSKGMMKYDFLNDYLARHPSRNPAEAHDLWDAGEAFEDLGSVANGILGGKLTNPDPRHDHYLNADIFKSHATRVHRHLLKELAGRNVPSDTASQENEDTTLGFDKEKGILNVRGKQVKFRKLTEQYHTLALMFANPKDLKKEWFFSELAEKIDVVKKYTDKDFHNYFSAIKRRVAADTGIKDLFITTTQSVKINTDYLK